MICYCEKKKKLISVKRAMKKCVKANLIKRGSVCHYLQLKGGCHEIADFVQMLGLREDKKNGQMGIYDRKGISATASERV